MPDSRETLHWSQLARPYGKAERALGRLAHALDSSRLHQTWLWREISRTSVMIVQAGGYQANVDQLRRMLIGAPIEGDENTSGLAAAKRVFLTAATLFRRSRKTDSSNGLWPEFWTDPRLAGGAASDGGASQLSDEPSADDHNPSGGGEGSRARERLAVMARELAGFADDGRRPALINLFMGLRRQAGGKRLSPHHLRLALPLALVEAGLVPKAAPGLLGGRRLPLGLSAASAQAKRLSDWLDEGLDALATEARQSHRRLAELTRQHLAWHGALAGAGLRRHARAPKALDLLAATPVLNIGLVAVHLDCSHVAAGGIIGRLVDLGILIEQTSRSRHKVFVAGDLPAGDGGVTAGSAPLSLSEPMPAVDVDAIGATLDGLYADLDRITVRARTDLAGGKG